MGTAFKTPSGPVAVAGVATALALALAGCLATQGVVVNTSSLPPTGAGVPSTPASGGAPGWLPSWLGGSAPEGPPPMKDGKPIVSTIRSQLQCKTPPENYDFMGVITARYGSEAALRMQRLLSSDFADASITKQDRAMLNFMAREMLWIPVPVEEKLGAAMLAASSSDLTVLENDVLNKPLWDQTVQIVRELSAAAPPNPFDTRLILLQKGAPGSLAGGVIFIDNDMLKSVFDSEKPSLEKLSFVVAHELAHIHRRHRAKRIQQLLVDSEAGLRLMRQIIARAQAGGSGFTPAAIGEWIKTVSAVQDVAKELMKHHAKYEQDQEYEADACATALMMDAQAGDPLRAFQAYRGDVEKQARPQATAASAPGQGETFATHPPNSAREAKIKEKMLEYRVGSKAIGTLEKPFVPLGGASAPAGKVKAAATKAGNAGTAGATGAAGATSAKGAVAAVKPAAPAASKPAAK